MSLRATNGDFTCRFEWQTAAGSGFTRYAAVALDGSFYEGALPARACVLYAVPSASLRVHPWQPWFMGGTPLYRRKNLTESALDLNVSALFAALSITGSFYEGDIVLPMLAGDKGAPAGDAMAVASDGRGLALSAASKVTQAMLYLNTHEPLERFPRNA